MAYEKKTWIDDEVIERSEMQNIEDGINTAHDNIDSHISDATTHLTSAQNDGLDGANAPGSSNVFATILDIALTIDDTAYNESTWNGDTDAASKNAIRDKIVAIDSSVSINTIHKTSNGSDHTFIDQDVTNGSSPTFDGANIINVDADTLIADVKEANVSAVTKGQMCAIIGSSGNKFEVQLCDCDDANLIRVLGLVVADTAQNETGQVVHKGLLTNVNTQIGNTDVNPNSETWAAGDMLFVASTPGGLTNVRPSVGRCIKAGRTLKGNSASDTLLAIVHTNDISACAAAGEDLCNRMGDNDGVNKCTFKDYDNNEVAAFDSNGNLTLIGNVDGRDVSVDGTKLDDLSKSATVVVGKSGAVDYLTTDYASDDTCIQAAINYVNGLGGGSVFIREGVYALSSGLNLTQDSTTKSISINGTGQSTELQAQSDFNVLYTNASATEQRNITLCDLMISYDSSLGTLSNYLIDFQDVVWMSIHNVIFNNLSPSLSGEGGIRLRKTSLSNMFCNNIRNSFFRSCNITIDDCTDSIISNCYIDGHLQAYAIKITGVGGMSIDNNLIISGQTYGGLYIPTDAQILRVSNNFFDGSYNAVATSNGIHSKWMTKSLITGNTFWNHTKSGIYSADMYGTVITGNSFHDNNKGDLNYSDIIIKGVSGGGNANIITSNVFRRDDATRTNLGYAIEETNGGNDPQKNTIANNSIFTANYASPVILNLNKNGKIINNIGYNPVGNFTAPSVPATTVNYTNAYGYPCQVQVYGGTVTEIDIDDIATGLTSGVFILPPSGTINITYSAPPSWRWWGL